MKTFTTLAIALLATLSAVEAAPQRGNFRNFRGGRNRGGANAASSSVAAVATATPVTGGNAAVVGGAAGGAAAGGAAAGGAATGATAGGAVTRGASTIVLKEVGGIPGNECLTFRNNGEMVDAACVNTAADRQVTPSTNAAGADVLLVQRSFTAGFRPDLVDAQACVGFNGTTFKAVDCEATGVTLVSLVDSQLVAGTACQSGHDDKAQLTVDPTGANCVDVTTTTVTPTAP